MRKVLGRVAVSFQRFARGAGRAQGLVGVGCLSSGVYVEFGQGFALIFLGVFLLLGAWGSR